MHARFLWSQNIITSACGIHSPRLLPLTIEKPTLSTVGHRSYAPLNWPLKPIDSAS